MEPLLRQHFVKCLVHVMWVAAATSDTALCSIWAAVKRGEECVQSVSIEQKAKRGEDTGGEVRWREERKSREKKGK